MTALIPAAVQQPFEYGPVGQRILGPRVPVRFDAGSIVVTLADGDYVFDHPVGTVLSKIVDGEQFTGAHLKSEFYALRLFDFVNVFACTEYVLGALEVGCRFPAQELMAAKLNGMAMASRFKDAGLRARFVQNFCRAIGRCGFVPEAA